MRSVSLALLMWTLSLSLLVGCASSPTPPVLTTTPTPPAAPTAASTAIPPREIVVALPEPPDSLNPLFARSWSARALQDLYLVGLWHLDGELALHPELAADIPTRANGGISADGRTLTVALRPDATWSDGQPVTAADIVFTYRMAIAPGNSLGSRFPYTAVDDVVALDPRTVQVRFSRPFAPWPATLFPFVLPRHVLEPVFDRDGTLDRAVWNRMPSVGTGPFVFAMESEGDFIFEANPLYWRGRPSADRIRVRFLPAPEGRVAAVRRGAVDLSPLLWPEGPGWVSAPPRVRVLNGATGLVETIFFNLESGAGHPALHQSIVRRAIALTLDRGLVCDLLPPQAQPASTLWSDTLFEDPAFRLPDGAAEAARLLEEAGWRDEDGDGVRQRDGVSLSLRYAALSSEVDRAAARESVAQMLAAVGIAVEHVAWDGGSGWDLAQWAEAPLGYPDPDDPRWLCVESGGGVNLSGVCEEDVDALLHAQASTVDVSERATLFYELETLNQTGAWWIPLCQLSDSWLASEDIRSAHPWRGAPFWDAWWW